MRKGCIFFTVLGKKSEKTGRKIKEIGKGR